MCDWSEAFMSEKLDFVACRFCGDPIHLTVKEHARGETFPTFFMQRHIEDKHPAEFRKFLNNRKKAREKKEAFPGLKA
jgi:hypothetical protein